MQLQPLNIPLRPVLLPGPAEPLAAFSLLMELKMFALILSLFHKLFIEIFPGLPHRGSALRFASNSFLMSLSRHTFALEEQLLASNCPLWCSASPFLGL